MAVDVFQALLREIAQRVVTFYRQYPARSVSYVVSAVVAVAGFAGVGVDVDTLAGILSVVLPVLLGGELVHGRVTPVPQEDSG
jgi:hypothetical protein